MSLKGIISVSKFHISRTEMSAVKSSWKHKSLSFNLQHPCLFQQVPKPQGQVQGRVGGTRESQGLLFFSSRLCEKPCLKWRMAGSMLDTFLWPLHAHTCVYTHIHICTLIYTHVHTHTINTHIQHKNNTSRVYSRNM